TPHRQGNDGRSKGPPQAPRRGAASGATESEATMGLTLLTVLAPLPANAAAARPARRRWAAASGLLVAAASALLLAGLAAWGRDPAVARASGAGRGRVGTTYYVSPTGSDSNPGTFARPFATVNRGVRVLRPGDTLLVRKGTYPEALRNVIPSGTSWSA